MWRAILTRKFASRRSRLVRKNGCSWTTTTTSNTTAIISTNQSRPLLCCSSLSLADPPTSTCSPFLTTARTFHTLNSSSFVDNNNHYNYNHFHHHQYQQHRTKVFVSRYNDALNITVPMILDQCRNYNISPEETRTTRCHVVLKECPFCTKPTHDKPDNFYKLYVSIGSGCYFCHRCGNKGSWFDFKLNTERFDVVHVAGGNGSSCSGSGSGNGRLPTSARASNDVHANDRDSEHWNRRNNNPNTASSSSRSSTTTTIPPLPMPSERLAACYISALVDQKPSNDNTNQNPVLDYLTNVRGLHKTTLRKYGVGRANYNFPTTNSSTTTHNGRQQYTSAECVTFPWIMKASEVHEQEQLRGSQFLPYNDNDNEDKTVTRRIKARALQEKSWQRLDPPGGGWGLFGFHTIPEDATEVVITEGEYDAMAVYQATGRPAVSLPNGCRSLPVEVLPMLERFEKIYLWMDNDAPGQEGAEKFAKKIGQNRCLIVRPDMVGGEEACSSPKDANEALLKGVDMQQMLDNAKVVPHEMVLSFEDLRTSVLHEIVHPDKYVGAPAPSLPLFTSVVKGFRRGEMTVLTGPTGSGKTTFLGQLSLDFAEQGINTLWGSFEIKNTRLMQKLLQQFSRQPLPVGKPEMAEALNALADRFQSLPLYFMKFHGGSDVDDVLDAMDYAVYVHDVEHIILDNMQFMISRQKLGSGTFDKFDVQDIAVEKFRKFATDRNVHVTLVVHPRKEDEGAKLGMSSIYGSAKATQEADTVLILQNDGRRKYIDVKKNRFDGTLGHTPLHFDHKSGRYSEKADVGVDPQRALPPRSQQLVGLGKIQATFSSGNEQLIRNKHSSASTSSDEIDDHWDNILNNNRQ